MCRFCLFGVLRRFQHCTGHITTGSWKGRGNQYIEFARELCVGNQGWVFDVKNSVKNWLKPSEKTGLNRQKLTKTFETVKMS